MKIINLTLTILIILSILNTTFLFEISKNQDLSKFYYKGEELPNNYIEKEKIHMQEVKDLVNFSLVLNLLFLIATLILVRNTTPNMKTLGKILIFIAFLLFLGAISFQQFFHNFHLLVFNSENWLLPASSILIQTYPLIYFQTRFIIITSIILVLGIILTNNLFLKGSNK